MSNLPQTSLGRYHYTALDKLSACTLGAQPGSQRFYLGKRLSTEIQGAVQHSVMQHEDQLLAQQQRQAGTLHTHLLATDQQRSVLTLLDASRPQHLAYSPYGHRRPENGLLSLLGFNGERPDPVTGGYLLGNGYRAFNPVLMRFNSPDSWSPFGRGGLNSYGYCVGDPINRRDPNGHTPAILKAALRFLRIMKPSTKATTNIIPTPSISESTTTVATTNELSKTTNDRPKFIGYHGTSLENAESMLKTGVHSDSRSFFITNTYDGAQSYAGLHQNGAVVSVHTNNFDFLHSNAARGTAKAGLTQIDQVSIAKAAHNSLTFKITTDPQVSSNFNHFMSEQEHTNYWVMKFRQQH